MLDSLISDNKQIENNFRLWISAKISSSLPVSLLQLTVKVVADSPKVLKLSWTAKNARVATSPMKYLNSLTNKPISGCVRMACEWLVTDEPFASYQQTCCNLIVKTSYPQAASTNLINKPVNDKF